MLYCAACGEQTTTRPCQACGVDPLLVGQYALRELLGQGSHGMTWRADGPDGTVAVKVINLGHRLDPEAARALDREVAVLQQLSHPQIPALIEHFSMRSGMTRYRCIVQAFIDGPNLLDELDATRHTPQQVMATVAEVAEILGYLHGLSPPIIHRDIKPQNLIRRADDGALVLIDFGSVRDTMVGTLGGTMSVGTVGYMAPEQVSGDVRPESDVYALGALAVHLLTRLPPRLPLSPDRPIQWQKPTGLPRPIGDLIDRMLLSDPARRPTSAAVARAARRLSQQAQHAPAPEPSAPPPPPEPIDDTEPTTPEVLPTLYGLLWLLGLGAMVGAMVEIETIIGTGLLGAAGGAIIGNMARKSKLRWGAISGFSAPVFSLLVFLWIVLGEVSPGDAAEPVPLLIGAYLAVLSLGLVKARRELRQREEIVTEFLARPVTSTAAERRARRADVKIDL